MLGNIVDRRTSHLCPSCDVVFEPSTHDNVMRADGTEWFPGPLAMDYEDYFFAKELIDTTIRDAVLFAETSWSFPVTVFIYDKGIRPISG